MEATSESQLTAQSPMPSKPGDSLRAAWLAVLSPAAALAAGLVLRLWILKDLCHVDGDSLVYGALAKNLLLHGRYAFAAANGQMVPTLIRLPGYPLLLALCFRLFGMENYYFAALLQIVLELAGCLLLAEFAARISPPDLASGARLVI